MGDDYYRPGIDGPTPSIVDKNVKQIDEIRLESDLAYRYEYLTEFIGFSEQCDRRLKGSHFRRRFGSHFLMLPSCAFFVRRFS